MLAAACSSHPEHAFAECPRLTVTCCPATFGAAFLLTRLTASSFSRVREGANWSDFGARGGGASSINHAAQAERFITVIFC